MYSAQLHHIASRMESLEGHFATSGDGDNDPGAGEVQEQGGVLAAGKDAAQMEGKGGGRSESQRIKRRLLKEVRLSPLTRLVEANELLRLKHRFHRIVAARCRFRLKDPSKIFHPTPLRISHVYSQAWETQRVRNAYGRGMYRAHLCQSLIEVLLDA